jgi:hypothetical protein
MLRAGEYRESDRGLGRSSFAEAVRSEIGFDSAGDRAVSSFFLSEAPCKSAEDWNWKLLW